jgi:uncharacterized protein YheU (UPF0270 family)
MVKIPLSQLSEQALNGVVEAFVLREGTDYGHADHTLADKCQRVLDQLHNGEAELCFDPESNSIDIRTI